MSYYQLAKICALKGEKDKAINFINKAIELEPKLLKIAAKDRAFKDIREYITVSVDMNEKAEKVHEEESDEIKNVQDKKTHILKREERAAQIFLEETNNLIDEISENTDNKDQEKVKELEEREPKRSSMIIDTERLKRLEEIDNREEQEKENEKVETDE